MAKENDLYAMELKGFVPSMYFIHATLGRVVLECIMSSPHVSMAWSCWVTIADRVFQ